MSIEQIIERYVNETNEKDWRNIYVDVRIFNGNNKQVGKCDSCSIKDYTPFMDFDDTFIQKGTDSNYYALVTNEEYTHSIKYKHKKQPGARSWQDHTINLSKTDYPGLRKSERKSIKWSFKVYDGKNKLRESNIYEIRPSVVGDRINNDFAAAVLRHGFDSYIVITMI